MNKLIIYIFLLVNLCSNINIDYRWLMSEINNYTEKNNELFLSPSPAIILAYGDINNDNSLEIFIGEWNISVTNSYCAFTAYDHTGTKISSNTFISYDNIPFTNIYYNDIDNSYIAENNYYLKSNDGNELQMTQYLIYQNDVWKTIDNNEFIDMSLYTPTNTELNYAKISTSEDISYVIIDLLNLKGAA